MELSPFYIGDMQVFVNIVAFYLGYLLFLVNKTKDLIKQTWEHTLILGRCYMRVYQTGLLRLAFIGNLKG
jgi:hypothetical protein